MQATAVTAATRRHGEGVRRLGVDLCDELNFDRDAARQTIGAHGGARVDASLAKDLAQQVRAPVHHLGLLGVVVGAVDEADHLDNPPHLVELSDGRLERGDQLEGDELGDLEREVRNAAEAEESAEKWWGGRPVSSGSCSGASPNAASYTSS